MHEEAMVFVGSVRTGLMNIGDLRILELGSRDVNGSPRRLFAGCKEYIGVDMVPGPGVDKVMDCRAFDGDHGFDVCLCLEAMEHERDPEVFVRTARRSLRSRGLFIVTAAAPPRRPHSCNGGPLGEEYYTNIFPSYLREVLSAWRDVVVHYDNHHGDVYASALISKLGS